MFLTELNFITEQERVSVRDQIFDLKKHWNNLHPTWNNGVKFSTLGDALYILAVERLPVQQVNRHKRQILIDRFNWLFQRMCEWIADQTQINTELHPYLTVPGFHICDQPGEHADFYYSNSGIMRYDSKANMETNRSLLIPIEVPSADAHMPYELCGLYQWDNNFDYKIGSTIKPGEYRITLQAHYFCDKTAQVNYLYF